MRKARCIILGDLHINSSAAEKERARKILTLIQANPDGVMLSVGDEECRVPDDVEVTR